MVIGIGSRLSEIAAVGLEILYLTLLVVAIHGFVVYGGARLLRLDLATASSQAAIGGPSTAIALTAARGWPELTLPGMAVGLLGYALGNYAGLVLAGVLMGSLSRERPHSSWRSFKMGKRRFPKTTEPTLLQEHTTASSTL